MKTTNELLAELLAGLQVPLSLGPILGAAEAPYRELLARSNTFGWRSAEDFKTLLEERE